MIRTKKIILTLIIVCFGLMILREKLIIKNDTSDKKIKYITIDSPINTERLLKRYSSSDYLTLDRVSNLIGINNKWNNGFTGKGVTVAILDSGTYPHTDLTMPINHIIAFKDYINHEDSPYDDNGHGTLIAGIISGSGYMSNGVFKGIAPAANIVSVKVLNKGGTGKVQDIINGIDWVIENSSKYNIRIMNLSLGIEINNSIEEDKLSYACDKAVKLGLMVITSVGNQSNKVVKYSPAISPKVIAVGSVNNDNTSKISDFIMEEYSNKWQSNTKTSKPDFVTLGNNIVSLQSDIWYDPNLNYTLKNNFTYVDGSGTSLSSAIVTGIAAILMERFPNKNNDEIKQLLKENSVRIDAPMISQGNGYIFINK